MSIEEIAGLILVTIGQLGLLLLGFAPREIVTAARSAYFWEAAARNAWILAALAGNIGFVTLICSPSDGPSGFMTGVGRRVPAVALALVLTTLFAVLAIRTAQRTNEPRPPLERGGSLVGAGLGLLLFAGVIALQIHLHPGAAHDVRAAVMLLHWPAWLLVVGGALAVAVSLGDWRKGESLALGIASAGTITALFGLAQAFRGFATGSGASLIGGLTLLLSSCFAALVCLAAVPPPLQDRSHRPASAASRFGWYGLPVIAWIMLVFAVILSIIPLRVKG
jgi:hypothetical protein